MTTKIDGTLGITFPDSTVQATAAINIGVGQSWQDLTVSRAVNVTYTNSTSKPIQVAVSLNNVSSSTFFYFYVNSVIVSSQARNGNLNNTAFVTAIIPVGSTYRADIAVGGNGFSLASWSELR
jgi:hypothetical protein